MNDIYLCTSCTTRFIACFIIRDDGRDSLLLFLCVTRVINDDNDVDGRTLMLNNSKVVEITQQLLLLFALINFSCNLSVSH